MPRHCCFISNSSFQSLIIISVISEKQSFIIPSDFNDKWETTSLSTVVTIIRNRCDSWWKTNKIHRHNTSPSGVGDVFIHHDIPHSLQTSSRVHPNVSHWVLHITHATVIHWCDSITHIQSFHVIWLSQYVLLNSILLISFYMKWNNPLFHHSWKGIPVLTLLWYVCE